MKFTAFTPHKFDEDQRFGVGSTPYLPMDNTRYSTLTDAQIAAALAQQAYDLGVGEGRRAVRDELLKTLGIVTRLGR